MTTSGSELFNARERCAVRHSCQAHSVRWADEMADRFEDVSDEDIELLLEKRDSNSTKNVIKGAVRILQTYCLCMYLR